MKLLFLKVRNALIPAILCDSTIFGIKGDDDVKEGTYEMLKDVINAALWYVVEHCSTPPKQPK